MEAINAFGVGYGGTCELICTKIWDTIIETGGQLLIEVKVGRRSIGIREWTGVGGRICKQDWHGIVGFGKNNVLL